MSGEPEDLVLAMLRRTDAKRDRGLEELHDVKLRLTAADERMAGVCRRIDTLDGRFQRVERHLDRVEATY